MQIAGRTYTIAGIAPPGSTRVEVLNGDDVHEVPIIENTAHECDLKDSLVVGLVRNGEADTRCSYDFVLTPGASETR